MRNGGKTPPSFGTLKVGARNTQSPRRKTGKRHFPGWIELEEEEVSSIRDEKEYNYKYHACRCGRKLLV